MEFRYRDGVDKIEIKSFKKLQIWVFGLTCFALPIKSEPLYIPRYTPSFFELSLCGTQGLTYTKSKSELVTGGKFAITGNPFPFFSVDELSFGSYFSFLLGFSMDAMDSKSNKIFDSSYTYAGNDLVLKKYHGNDQHSFDAQVKYGLLPFLDMTLGGGIIFSTDNVTVEVAHPETGQDPNFLSKDLSKSRSNYFYEVGLDLFFPRFPQHILSTCVQILDSHASHTFRHDFDPSFFPGGVETEVKQNPYRIYLGYTFSLRVKSPVLKKQAFLENEIRRFGSEIRALPIEGDSLERTARYSSALDSAFDGLPKKRDLRNVVARLKSDLYQKKRLLGRKKINEIKTQYRDGHVVSFIATLTPDYLVALHPKDRKDIENLFQEIYRSIASSLKPSDLYSISQTSLTSIGAVAKKELIKRFKSDSEKVVTSKELKAEFFLAYSRIPLFNEALVSLAKEFLDKDFEDVNQPQNLDIDSVIITYAHVSPEIDQGIDAYIKLCRVRIKIQELKVENPSKQVLIDSLKNWVRRVDLIIEKATKERRDYHPYRVVGTINDMTNHVALLWGQAFPEYSYDEWQPGTVREQNNITVLNSDKGSVQGGIAYVGVHCFINKIPAKGKYGQTVSNYIYGPCPEGLEKAERALNDLEKTKYEFNNRIRVIEKEMETGSAGIKELQSYEKKYESLLTW